MRQGIIIEPTLLNREFGVFKALCHASLSEEDRGEKQSTHLSFDRASIISPMVTRGIKSNSNLLDFFRHSVLCEIFINLIKGGVVKHL